MKIGLFRTMELSAAGLAVQRMRLDAVAENLANAETTKTAEGGPYRRKTVQIEAVRDRAAGDARSREFADLLAENRSFPVAAPRPAQQPLVPRGTVQADEGTPFTLSYQPGHPDADERGFVTMPNVNVIDEMVDMVVAQRAYEANVTAIQSAKDMFLKALEI